MKNIALSYLLLACAIPLCGAASEQMNTNNQASTVTLVTYDANKRKISLPVNKDCLLKLDMYANTNNAYGSIDTFDLTDFFSKADRLLNTGEKDFLQADSVRTLLSCLTRNPNGEITAYKNSCAALSHNNLISLWRAADFLDAPENLKLACAQRIVNENIRAKLNEIDEQAILTTVRSFQDAVHHCKPRVTDANCKPPVTDEIDLSGKKIGWSYDTISPHATKSVHDIPDRLERRSLNLRNNLLTSLDLSYYRRMFPNLNTFDVSGNKIMSISAGDFQDLPVGSRVILNDNQLSDATVDERAFSGHEEVTWDLRKNNLTPEKIATIREAAAKPSWFVALRNRLWQSGQTARPLFGPDTFGWQTRRFLTAGVVCIATATALWWKLLGKEGLHIELTQHQAECLSFNIGPKGMGSFTALPLILPLHTQLETSFQDIKLFLGKQFQPNTVIADDEQTQ